MRKKVKVESHPGASVSAEALYAVMRTLEQRYGTNRLYEDYGNFNLVPCSPTGRLVKTGQNFLLDDFQSQNRTMQPIPPVTFITLEMNFSEIEKRVLEAKEHYGK